MKSIQRRMEDALERIQEAGLSRITSTVQPLLLPSFRLSVDKPSSEPLTRLGGAPNLPMEYPWPTREDGEPLSFIAQVDLSKLEPIETFPLPSTGSLFFFYDTIDMPPGFDPKEKGGWKVVFSPASLSEVPMRRPPEGLEGDRVFKGYSLSPRIEITAPGWNNESIKELRMSDSEWDIYADLFSPEGIIHRMGGYPDEIQGSLKLEAELVSHGLYCGDSTGYAEAERRGLGAGAVDWGVLLQVDSEEDAGMMWYDAGRIYFLIRQQDLLLRRFEKSHVALQCG